MSSKAARVSYVVVEFIGSNWRNVQRIDISPHSTEFAMTNVWSDASPTLANTATISGLGGVALFDTSKAFCEFQRRNSSATATSDRKVWNLAISGVDQLTLRTGDSTQQADSHSVLWIMENTGGDLLVQRESTHHVAGTQGGTLTTYAIDVDAPIPDIDQASVWGYSRSHHDTGGGGLSNAGMQVADANTVNIIEARVVASRYEFELVSFPV